MKKIIIALLTITIFILIGLNLYFSRDIVSPTPIFTYTDSKKLINYYFNYENFKLIYNLQTDNIEVRNKNGDKVNLFDTGGNGKWYMENILKNWMTLPIDNNNNKQLLPPIECTHLLITTKIVNNSYNLYNLIDNWETCPNI